MFLYEDIMNHQMAFAHGGEYTDYNQIKLDFSVNTNPLGMPGNLSYALTTNVDVLEKYPDRRSRELCLAISEKRGVPSDNIFVGNGASEVISLLAKVLAPKNALIIEPTFSGYERALLSNGSKVSYYELTRENEYTLTQDFIAFLEKAKCGAIFACSPNNPTGHIIDLALVEEIAEICEKKKIFFILDECFMGFVENSDSRSCQKLLADHPHLILLDAFTKLYCIPGIRLGYCISSNNELIKALYDAQPEWSVSTYAQLAGKEALSEERYVKRTVELVSTERDYLIKELRLLGFEVYDSQANFILFNVASTLKKNRNLQEYLAKKHHILIRSCDNFKGLTEGDYRIAVKLHDENELLIEALKSFLSL
ncbi:MAG: aminotransferase class I/II-fold pyridoxal phosphate-dependent enzyme [Butyrivibrio sp.]|nr:aminotransferase class I/II-fold pyridoxal phosphate-dependent enzyme [Butyrivibrio sp.]